MSIRLFAEDADADADVPDVADVADAVPAAPAPPADVKEKL